MRRIGVVLALGMGLSACAGDGDRAATTATTPPTTSATATQAPPGVPPYDAWVGVAVATLWAAPDQARPLDAPSLANPVDIPAWLAAMTVDDRRWLVDRLVTQALYGDRVTVVETAGAWSRVVVLRQPTSLDPRGYPGWLPTAQLTTVAPAAPAGPQEVVVRARSTTLLDGDRPVMDLSFNTRLAALSAGATSVTVALPGGGRGRLASADVTVLPGSPPTPEEVVRSAEQFSGVDYLWAGTSGAGWDCSGFTHAVYAARGVVIPRDAHDQAATGTPVERAADLLPGDLLFYGDGDDVTHVGMYVGDGRMIQAPATGRPVETVPIDAPGLTTRFIAARRYLSEGA